MWESIVASLGALIPSVGVLAIFLLILRAMVLADRKERSQRLREEALEDRAAAAAAAAAAEREPQSPASK